MLVNTSARSLSAISNVTALSVSARLPTQPSFAHTLTQAVNQIRSLSLGVDFKYWEAELLRTALTRRMGVEISHEELAALLLVLTDEDFEQMLHDVGIQTHPA